MGYTGKALWDIQINIVIGTGSEGPGIVLRRPIYIQTQGSWDNIFIKSIQDDVWMKVILISNCDNKFTYS